MLVIDDERGVRESLRMLLRGAHEVLVAENAQEGLAAVAEHAPDLILLDLVMPGQSGLDFLAAWRERGAFPPVIVVTATRTVESAVEAMRLGASDYVTKPFEAAALRERVAKLVSPTKGPQEGAPQAHPEVVGAETSLLGESAAMCALRETLSRVALNSANVLITGESGTGKELVARAIHETGLRRDQPFVPVNCAAIPDALLESELFGHERGAFTDAVERRIGKFEAAGGGTLFLDEVAELGLSVQAKLLRALQERVIERIGGGDEIEISARVVAATHRDLEAEIAEGRFRQDLFFRIHVIPVHVPPLRERAGDVPLLAQAFLTRAREREGHGPIRIHPAALQLLERYDWPGNVRELQNVIERCVALAPGSEIGVADLPADLQRTGEARALRGEVAEGHLRLDQATTNFERQILSEALERANWNQTRAAESLGITRRVLKRKMDRYGIASPAS
ncbi:MAG: sigma-54-dependent Fis family transcriptional regulator [Myxococcales bacterium]|nr:sigma-54-dependent Fis family transcriptional regulator [Myxococcales bacterium]